jgi:hypothetical protein
VQLGLGFGLGFKFFTGLALRHNQQGRNMDKKIASTHKAQHIHIDMMNNKMT